MSFELSSQEQHQTESTGSLVPEVVLQAGHAKTEFDRVKSLIDVQRDLLSFDTLELQNMLHSLLETEHTFKDLDREMNTSSQEGVDTASIRRAYERLGGEKGRQELLYEFLPRVERAYAKATYRDWRKTEDPKEIFQQVAEDEQYRNGEIGKTMGKFMRGEKLEKSEAQGLRWELMEQRMAQLLKEEMVDQGYR